MKTFRAMIAAMLVLLIGQTAPLRIEVGSLEKRGCCSHYKGVCGCEDNRAKCCDGTLSPTCGC